MFVPDKKLDNVFMQQIYYNTKSAILKCKSNKELGFEDGQLIHGAQSIGKCFLGTENVYSMLIDIKVNKEEDLEADVLKLLSTSPGFIPIDVEFNQQKLIYIVHKYLEFAMTLHYPEPFKENLEYPKWASKL